MFRVETDFEDGQRMPDKYANVGVPGGENVSIPLIWENSPEGTKSFAVAMVDRHTVADNWVHWLVINIPESATSLPEGASGGGDMPSPAKELNNTFGFPGYGGPQPPGGTGDHEYETTIYALDTETVPIEADTTLDEFMQAIDGNILESASVTGVYSQ